MFAGAVMAIALACVAPLFAGGITPRGVLVVELAAFAAATVGAWSGRSAPRAPATAATLIAALGVVGILQWTPLPPSAIAVISPAAADAWAEAGAVLEGQGNPSPAPRLSIAPRETLAAVVLTFAFAAITWGSSLLRPTWVAEVFIVAGLLQVLLRSFVVSNHDAAFLLMPLAVAVGMARTSAGPQKRWSMVATAVFALAIIATGSRGGMVAAAASVTFLLLWNGRPALLALATAGGAAAAVVGTILLSDPRVTLWTYAVEAWRRFPIVGSGLGSFPDAFAIAGAPPTLGIVPHAHNGWLQLAVTAGALGAVVVLAIGLVISRARFPHTALGLGAAGATVALAIHGSIDFSFSLPAITASYLCLFGAAMSVERPPDAGAARA